jgi:hypothetical protein
MNFTKDPNAILDYRFDWKAATNGNGTSDYLAASEIITGHTIVAADGITVQSSALVDTATAVVVWLSGGSVGARYSVTCRVTTSAGRTDDRTIYVIVGEQ